MKEHAPEVMSATTIIGNDVRNAEGESLGKIEEIMFDRYNGTIAYAVVSFGGFLGIGDKLFAVPWSQISINTIDKCCVMDVSKERLENAPGFDKDDWPSHEDTRFLDSVFTYYDVTPYYAVNA